MEKCSKCFDSFRNSLKKPDFVFALLAIMFSNGTDIITIIKNLPKIKPDESKTDKRKTDKSYVSLAMSGVSSLLVFVYLCIYFKFGCCGKDAEPTPEPTNTEESNVDQVENSEVENSESKKSKKSRWLKPCMDVIFCFIILTNTISYGTSFL